MKRYQIMKPGNRFILSKISVIILCLISVNETYGKNFSEGIDEIRKLDNPFTVSYIKKNLNKQTPRLIITPEIINDLKVKTKTDSLVSNYYQAIKINAEKVLNEPLLEMKIEDDMISRQWFLGVARQMLYRMNILGMVYLMENDPSILSRINEELIAVCNFPDWHPAHFLDVAEMSMAVAFAVDWVGRDLPESTVNLAVDALIKKGIEPSYEGQRGWIDGNNNWNQVCNGGMIAASIVIAERDPDLAARTISRSLDGIPYALESYSPDGVYPEGPTYWGYGTQFSVLTSSMLTTAFGTDFGIAEYPAFMESADFRVLTVAPTGLYWNFADTGNSPGKNGDIRLAWFAAKTGNTLYIERDKFMAPPESMGTLNRTAGPGLIWLSQIEESQTTSLPTAWKGEGENPIVIFRNGDNDQDKYYFGGKGGKATLNHGHMDAGSFIFELDSVRWSVEIGQQNYHIIEQEGFNLWGRCQECERWTLLSTNNSGHSTLTVNNEPFINDGFVPIIDFQEGVKPEFTMDMSALYGDNLNNATRRFVKEDNRSILIEDVIELNDLTESLTWQMMTTAEVELMKGGALLKQDGKQLRMEILSHPNLSVSVISLDPPPFYLDKQIDNLKRIEINIPAWISETKRETIRVRLTGSGI
ncbi:MAG: heparinase II/III family protein [Bacteroidales bacterium]